MSFLEAIFGGKSDETSRLDWNSLTNIKQLETIVKDSKTKPQLIFKHSTRCGISRNVLKKFEKKFDTSNSIDLYFLDLLNNRTISNEVASKFNVKHESPQLLVIRDGKVTGHASHGGILDLEF